MRKLASIQKVEWIAPIEGKDRIELVGVLGFQVICKKGEYQVGDKTVFCETDSVLPDKPEFDFLRSKKFRIKTMKMGGILSQGICFPLDVLPKGNYDIDDDVTEILGVKKYEVTADVDPVKVVKQPKSKIGKYLMKFKIYRMLFGTKKKQRQGFPSFIVKTDESRIQNIPHILQNKEIKYMVHEKLDGTSLTTFLARKKIFGITVGYDFGVCSRNLRLYEDDGSVYWQIAKKHNMKEVLKLLIGDSDWVTIQGEILAPNIQGNKYKVTEPTLYAFNLIYSDRKINSLDAEEILRDYGISFVPLLYKDFTLPDTVNEFLDFAEGKSKIGETLREGLVCRNYDKKISFKVVSPTFLIKYDA